MRARTLSSLIVCASLFVPGAALAGISVRFVNPERYTDADFDILGSYPYTVAAFRSYLEGLGKALLAPGQDLSIEVLNIDLAGWVQPWRGNNIRVLRDFDPALVQAALRSEGKRPAAATGRGNAHGLQLSEQWSRPVRTFRLREDAAARLVQAALRQRPLLRARVLKLSCACSPAPAARTENLPAPRLAPGVGRPAASPDARRCRAVSSL